MTLKYKYKRYNVPAIKHNRRRTDNLENKALATHADLNESKKDIEKKLSQIQKKLDVIINKLKENDPLYV